MHRRALFFCVPAAMLLLVGCDIEELTGSTRYTEDFHHSHLLKPGGRISVESFNGSIEISGWDENQVDISGTKYASSQELLDAVKIDVVASGDAVRIRTIRPSERRGNMGAKYYIKVPRRVELERIASSNGGIRASAIEGDARIKTSNGPVRVLDVRGELDIATTNGSIEVQNHQGAVVLRTSNGRIRAEDVRGALEASTSNGSINVSLAESAAGRPVKLDTTNGGVELTLKESFRNDVQISTSNGGITLHLPSAMGARLDARTSNASIHTEFDVRPEGPVSKHRLLGTIGGGGPLLDLSTTNGGIRVLKL